MLLRELTKDIKKPVNEAGPLGWALVDLILGTKSTAGPRETEMGAGDQLYRALKDQSPEDRESIAQDFEAKIKNPATADEAWSVWEKVTGQSRTSSFDYVAPPSSAPRDGGNPGGTTTAVDQPNQSQTTTDKPPVASAPITKPNVTKAPTPPVVPKTTTAPKVTTIEPTVKAPTNKPAYDDAILRQNRTQISKVPNVVADPKAASEFAKTTPKSAVDIAQGINTITKGKVPPQQVNGLAQMATKYALPAAGIVAILYGGKKLYDYLSKRKKKESIGEAHTAGATSAGDIASVPNPKAAYAKVKRDKNGIPKAPQRKNPDGTAISALDVNDSLMGNGKVVKR